METHYGKVRRLIKEASETALDWRNAIMNSEQCRTIGLTEQAEEASKQARQNKAMLLAELKAIVAELE